jgi:hypothetical protein
MKTLVKVGLALGALSSAGLALYLIESAKSPAPTLPGKGKACPIDPNKVAASAPVTLLAKLAQSGTTLQAAVGDTIITRLALPAGAKDWAVSVDDDSVLRKERHTTGPVGDGLPGTAVDDFWTAIGSGVAVLTGQVVGGSAKFTLTVKVVCG